MTQLGSATLAVGSLGSIIMGNLLGEAAIPVAIFLTSCFIAYLVHRLATP